MIWIVDRFGRRGPLLVGAIGAAVAMFYLAIYSQLSQSFDQVPPSDSGSRTAVAMIYIYAIFYGFSWNGIPWIFASEVLPTRVRTIGMMCAVCMQWLAQFIIVYPLPYMIASINYGTFYFFGACTIVALVFACLFRKRRGFLWRIWASYLGQMLVSLLRRPERIIQSFDRRSRRWLLKFSWRSRLVLPMWRKCEGKSSSILRMVEERCINMESRQQ